jgi:hypothetical protein
MDGVAHNSSDIFIKKTYLLCRRQADDKNEERGTYQYRNENNAQLLQRNLQEFDLQMNVQFIDPQISMIFVGFLNYVIHFLCI